MTMFTNTIVCYLIRENYSDFDGIIDTDHTTLLNYEDLELEGVSAARFYYRNSFGVQPEWLSKFFRDSLDEEVKKHIYASNTQALVLMKVPVQTGSRFFVISFGTGRFLIRPESIERNFGLRTVLNLTKANQSRHLDKKVISSNPKQTRE